MDSWTVPVQSPAWRAELSKQCQMLKFMPMTFKFGQFIF